MKVAAIIRAYYNGAIIKPGEIVNIKGDVVPSWAKKIHPQKKENKQDVQPEQPVQTQLIKEDTSTNTEVSQNEDNMPENDNISDEELPSDDLSSKTEEELLAILEDLQIKGLEKDIMINPENKTIIEQINELKTALAPEGE